MRIGLHLSSRGGVVNALEVARELQTDVVQVFIGNPRAWRVSDLVSASAAREVREATDRLGVDWYVHLPYLINIASPEAEQYAKSRAALIDYCTTACTMGAKGLVLHVGSHRGAGFDQVRDQIVSALHGCVDVLQNGTALLLENAAGQKGAVGSSLDDLWKLFTGLPEDRLGLCLDTAHLMGAGIEFRTQDRLDSLVREIADQIGITRLGLIHLNDSKRSLGSRRDLHENLGFGSVGVDGFGPLLRCEELADVPAVLEVPGLDGSGPDKANLDVALAISRGESPKVEASFNEQMSLDW